VKQPFLKRHTRVELHPPALTVQFGIDDHDC
jgi:hypothetical protein